MDRIDIIEYEDKYHKRFKEISYEWLVKYDLLEPEDEIILNSPRDQVLDKGGKIFLARCNGEIVGTSSIIKVDETTFELAKLGVSELYQRKGIAGKLVEKCIMASKEGSARNLILYTNHKLLSALKFYKQLGFTEMDLNENKYIVADIKMKLVL